MIALALSCSTRENPQRRSRQFLPEMINVNLHFWKQRNPGSGAIYNESGQDASKMSNVLKEQNQLVGVGPDAQSVSTQVQELQLGSGTTGEGATKSILWTSWEI